MTGPAPRPALESIPTYKPGRPAAAAEGAQAYKLSSNENPYPPLPGVFESAAAAVAAMNRYPDMGSVDLLDGLAKRFDVPVDDLAVGTGSVAVFYHLLQALVAEGDEVVYAWRSFEAYPIAVGITGGVSVTVPLTADARHDLDAMAEAITERTKVVIVCTPNNPTGPAVRREELLGFLERVPPHVLVVIDEAYREFVRDPDTIDAVELYRSSGNVCVLRTFSKAYGLAGFRVGFAVAPAPIAEAVRKCALPFGVSHVAQQAALASLHAEPALLERVEMIVGERQRVLSGLRSAGWEVPDTEANFVWMPLGEATVDFAAACESAGVTVRPFAGDGARVTIGEPEANDIFLGVARQFPRR
ncbi:MAG TPA: pyridoxal phosphate-dependent aminotransferase [Nocardioidaceae bacterium]|nr:pyridoxal phosphate-dependent aminotransferase [Nocardioidaceae bacterium]